MSLKQVRVILTLVVLIFSVSLILFWSKSSKNNNISSLPSNNIPPPTVSPTDKPQIVSTKPSPLGKAVIGASDTIEITFNRPMENVGVGLNKVKIVYTEKEV